MCGGDCLIAVLQHQKLLTQARTLLPDMLALKSREKASLFHARFLFYEGYRMMKVFHGETTFGILERIPFAPSQNRYKS